MDETQEKKTQEKVNGQIAHKYDKECRAQRDKYSI